MKIIDINYDELENAAQCIHKMIMYKRCANILGIKAKDLNMGHDNIEFQTDYDIEVSISEGFLPQDSVFINILDYTFGYKNVNLSSDIESILSKENVSIIYDILDDITFNLCTCNGDLDDVINDYIDETYFEDDEERDVFYSSVKKLHNSDIDVTEKEFKFLVSLTNYIYNYTVSAYIDQILTISVEYKDKYKIDTLLNDILECIEYYTFSIVENGSNYTLSIFLKHPAVVHMTYEECVYKLCDNIKLMLGGDKHEK